MPVDPSQTIYYRRARFTTRLPKSYRYALSHFWLEELEPDLFRVGITHFATRMLGDFVECEFQKNAGDRIERECHWDGSKDLKRYRIFTV
jgi:glycine cleavage system H protein